MRTDEELKKSQEEKVIDAELDAEEARESKHDEPASLDDMEKAHGDLAARWEAPNWEADGTHDVGPDALKVPEVKNKPEMKDAADDGEKDNAPPPMPAPEKLPEEPWANLQARLKQAQNPAKPAVDPLLEKMRSVGWAPPEKKEPNWEALQANLQHAERNRDLQGSIGAALHAAAPGYEPPHNAGEGAVAAAKSALEEPKQQALLEHSNAEAERLRLAEEEQKKKAAKTAEADDPNSEESKRARAALKAQFGDTGKLPPDLDKYSANDVAKLTPTLGTIAGHQSQESIAKKREEAAATEKRAEEKAKADAIDKAQTEKKADEEAKRVAATESLAGAKSLWLKTAPYAKEHALTPADLAGITDEKNWKDFLDHLPREKPGKGGPAAPPHETKTLQEIKEPGMRALVSSLLDNKPMPTSLDRKTKTQALEYVYQINPNWDPVRGEAYHAVALQQAGSKDKMAIDVALKHLDTAEKAIPANADAQFINKARQAVATGSGEAEFQPYVVASAVAAHELATVYNIGDQAGKEMMEHMLAAAQSPQQFKATFSTLKELVAGKKEGFERQLERVAPQSYAALKAAEFKATEGGAKGNGPPPSGSVTVFDTKTRTSKNVSKEKADAIMKADTDKRFQLVGEQSK